ncbi:MAG: nucleotide pyrophosphohydrolase [Thermaerobacter sp.]|nr:nucleotide pyrophosphohydrolase [Thermaerobacter sp.]
MTVAEVQRAVDRWIGRFAEGYFPPLAMVARLAEEVGELAREVNHTYGPKPKKPDEPPGSVAEELGDLLFVVASMANALDIDLTQAFLRAMQKFHDRDSERWTPRTNPPELD